MPHCIIEYSVELEEIIDPIQLVATAYQGALKSNIFNGDDIKSRSIAYKNYQCGNSKKSFIHVTVKILTGRTPEQHTSLSKSILSEFKKINLSSVIFTMEIAEIERNIYVKTKL
ncbi:MAG: 5-carboxymethyl-2-hydroxymuconate isomerase [Francisellaceae bacterium]|jgi:5-carboxymethyl-2-hydroxymuconate isomerase